MFDNNFEYNEILTEDEKILELINFLKSEPKILSLDFLNEFEEYSREIQLDETKLDDSYILNKILINIQDEFFKEIPFPYVYTRFAKNCLDKGEIENAVKIYEKIKNWSDKPNIQKIAVNALKRVEGHFDEKKYLDNIKNFDDAIVTAISLRRTRKMRFEFVLQIVDLAYSFATSTQDKLMVAIEYKRLKQTTKAKAILDAIKTSKLVRGKINDVVYAATLRKEKDYDMAICLYEKILQEEPKNMYAMTGLAAVYKDIGEYQKAYSLCEDILSKGVSMAILHVLESICKRTDNITLAKNIMKHLEKYYANFNPYKYLDKLIEQYSARKDSDGVNRITNIRNALEQSYNSI